MSEGDVASRPQVFVVDSQTGFFPPPRPVKKTQWTPTRSKCLLLVVVLAMLGLVVEGCFVYKLYMKTEAFSICVSDPLCRNMSNSKISAQQVGSFQDPAASKRGSNEIQPVQTLLGPKPFAHLICSSNPVGEKNVVLWVDKDGDAITHQMGYNNGRLLVEKEGYYYLYSKVQINAAEVCSLIQHKVMKDTAAYDQPIELMKSKRTRCWTPKPSSVKSSGGEDLWDSYLAGIFHLQSGDQIFITLDSIQKLRPGPTENFMGAFMVSP
ncbi:tumor necrosis factor ligand superfamily member 14-like [Syngnathus scovelli]|uniref:tumor necrosis factor ligand superfamily member 14-like n=1 Tax=Syngnathus scovelli TaxID=161590 RepID=UPI00211030DD|nr:tumor necrosis factor ligand superfamily member 14-like [Syngnathus scovelli]XP_049575780.1 tumor necrosis factor ligand superfamily member 14-like [Syngnathus scovelli]XP_049575781.1 tumor necrosis factor ligand superfamily member 14-like [Syngnathus scovelli]XP_049575782.1 tumor necrosis factor ligand superfamily member 14-like [Syngnathus scovelli]XP_049575783.1 tumor necrosis factor ligand superfamily member 14-like [Syngnathus scovelli]XP_049575784.1 tumor necrosis factor ligand superf